MDILSKQKRSEVMSNIGSKNTKPEMILRSHLFNLGYRFRIHKKDLPGKPDIVLSKFKTIIFVHGCFWHFHKDCKEGRIPSTNSKFWKDKLENNVSKDERHTESLRSAGWQVITVWECEIEKNINVVLDNLIPLMKNRNFGNSGK